jgi:hypothetical protein
MAVPRTAFVMAALCAAVAAPLPAGVLDPPGPPGPTMKTLAQIPPVWGLALDASDGEPNGCNSTRFTCVLGTAAVLDNETGLVWERAPVNLFGNNWQSTRSECAQSSVGSRGGWRLPSLTELTSLLVDLPPEAPLQVFPAGSAVPFWTMTAATGQPARAWAVTPAGMPERRLKSQSLFRWCVRAPAVLAEY